MGRLCCLKTPLQLAAVAELVKKHLNLQHIRVALARHKHMGEMVFEFLCEHALETVSPCTQFNTLLSGHVETCHFCSALV